MTQNPCRRWRRIAPTPPSTHASFLPPPPLLPTRLSKFERAEALQQIRAFVQAAWRTDEIRRSAPSPRDELRGGLSYFQETIFSALPTYVRRVDSALASIGAGQRAPSPLSHASESSSWLR